jgi:hypothetical protein
MALAHPLLGDSTTCSAAKALSLLPCLLCAREQGMASIVDAPKTPVCSLRDTFLDSFAGAAACGSLRFRGCGSKVEWESVPLAKQAGPVISRTHTSEKSNALTWVPWRPIVWPTGWNRSWTPGGEPLSQSLT